MPALGTTTKSDQRRQAVVEAAVHCFASKGYYGTSTGAVAARAGISQPYVYRLFPDKQSLFVAAANWASERLLAARLAHLEALSPEERKNPQAVLEAFRRGHADLVSQDRDLLLFLLQGSCAAGEPQIAAALQACYAAQVELIQTHSRASDEEVRRLFGSELLANVVLSLGADAAPAPWVRVLSGDPQA